jgi:hypothetical protein
VKYWNSIIASLCTLAVVILSILFPGQVLDAKVVVVVMIILLPLIAPSIKSIQLPYGIKIEFWPQDRTD